MAIKGAVARIPASLFYYALRPDNPPDSNLADYEASLSSLRLSLLFQVRTAILELLAAFRNGDSRKSR